MGPLGFSDKDPQGLLVEGFDQPRVIATTCNFPFLPELVEASGFSKEIDLVVYKVNIPEKVPEVYQRVSGWVLSREHLVIREFRQSNSFRYRYA